MYTLEEVSLIAGTQKIIDPVITSKIKSGVSYDSAFLNLNDEKWDRYADEMHNEKDIY